MRSIMMINSFYIINIEDREDWQNKIFTYLQ